MATFEPARQHTLITTPKQASEVCRMPSGPRRIRRGPQAFGLNLATSADLLRVWFAPRITGDEKSPLTCGHFHVTPLDAAEPAFRARARRIVPISELVFGALTQTG